MGTYGIIFTDHIMHKGDNHLINNRIIKKRGGETTGEGGRIQFLPSLFARSWKKDGEKEDPGPKTRQKSGAETRMGGGPLLQE